jgi:hypothetical protein
MLPFLQPVGLQPQQSSYRQPFQARLSDGAQTLFFNGVSFSAPFKRFAMASHIRFSILQKPSNNAKARLIRGKLLILSEVCTGLIL